MKNLQPDVSIITPVFNGADYIEDLIQSVLNQGDIQLEHIVIDDGSNDEGATVSVLMKYNHLRWWSRENKGQYATMNEGLLAARGRWVCFISADDLLAQNAVHSVLSFARDHAECDVIYGKSKFINQDGSDYIVQNLVKLVPKRLYGYLPGIYHCSMYLNREKLVQNDLLFDERLKYTGDFDWTTRVIRSNMKFGRLNKPLAAVRIHPNRASIVYKSEQDREQEALLSKYGYHLSVYRFVGWLRYIRSAGIEAYHYLRKGELVKLFRRIGKWFRQSRSI